MKPRAALDAERGANPTTGSPLVASSPYPGIPGQAPLLLRSASLRLATLHALVFGLSVLTLVTFLWWATAGLLDRQVDAAILTDAQGLIERLRQGGEEELARAIDDRMAEDVEDDAIYLLVNPRGRKIAGNLETWPSGVTSPEVSYERRLDRPGHPAPALLRRFDLPEGLHLLVGRDVSNRMQLRHLLADALFWALLIVAALGTAGALLVRSLFHRMLANVSVTAEAIAAGDLTQRVRLTGRSDEFDRLAETINDMLDRIARLMDGVRQVSNAIAHDLRTPITRARARLEDASAHARDAAELHAAVDRAIADLDGVVAVFEALLRIAEIEAGARRSAFGPLDLAPLLADLAELYGAATEEKGLHLALDAPPRLPAYGDRELIQQAVANLLDNAVKFSPSGADIRLTARSAGRMAVITVADRGPGIPESDRARATERFFRGETARHSPGAGLGLALVQAVAQLHGGVLRLEDNQPGLRAVLALPVQGRKED